MKELKKIIKFFLLNSKVMTKASIYKKKLIYYTLNPDEKLTTINKDVIMILDGRDSLV